MISVVIPLYNKERSIVTTLESVLAQTYTDYEVIIVDDGSTDRSADIVREYISTLQIDDFKFQILTQQNSGVSAARNRGIMEAKGEYVAFLDADDLWTNDYLETVAVLIRDYPGAGLYSVRYKVINDTQLPNVMQVKTDSHEIVRGYVSNPWNTKLRLFIGSVCVTKERLLKTGLFDVRITHGEDYDLCWRLILDGGLVQDNRCCAFYRMDSENRAMHRYPVIDKQISYYVDKFESAREGNADFRKFFDEQMVYRLYPYLLDKRYRKEARKIAKKFDYSQLKWSMHFRMLFPRIYYYYRKIF